jgi:peroxiredoxin
MPFGLRQQELPNAVCCSFFRSQSEKTNNQEKKRSAANDHISVARKSWKQDMFHVARLLMRRLLKLYIVLLGTALLLSSCAASASGPARPGEIAPAVQVTSLTGGPSTVQPVAGQALWLVFWASWCYPCRTEWPDLNQARADLADEGVTLIAISVNEQPSAVERFLAARPASFAVALDPQGEAAARYGVVGFPTHILIDQAGVVRQIVHGPLNEARARQVFGLK